MVRFPRVSGGSHWRASLGQRSQPRGMSSPMSLGVRVAGGGRAPGTGESWLARGGGGPARRPARWCRRGGGGGQGVLACPTPQLAGLLAARGAPRGVLSVVRGRQKRFEDYGGLVVSGSVSIAVRVRVQRAASARHAHPAVPRPTCLRSLRTTRVRIGGYGSVRGTSPPHVLGRRG